MDRASRTVRAPADRTGLSARSFLRLALVLGAVGGLAGCEEGAQLPAFLKPGDKGADAAPVQSDRTKLVARDVEAPDVFQVTEAGLWDGRPTLGGVWVAHPDVVEPERVIIRNTANGKFVIGALFRRERAIPGPRIQASSDAAEALGMLAGAPVQLNVTALRRETVEPEPEETEAMAPPGTIEETTLDPIAGAAAAIDATAPDSTAAATPEAPVAPAPKPVAEPASKLAKPYVQIGIFSVRANADRTAGQMRAAGMKPTVLEQELNGKQFWRVVVGPARTKSESSALLKKVKETGFSDAYAVSN